MIRNQLEGDQNTPPSAPEVVDAALAASVNVGRRRLFRGIGGGAGVLMAVSAKSALGGSCQSPSAMMSGNTSPRPGTGTTCSGGLSPGYWVQPQHSPNWVTAGGVFPQFDGAVVTCTTSLNKVGFTDITNQGTTLQSVFTGWTPQGSYQGPVSMWWVIDSPNDTMFGGPGGIGQLLRALSCAWLNAGYFQSSSAKYPLTKAQVVDMWVQLSTKGGYCPGTLTCTKPWSASQVVSYIEGMYDQNAPVDNLCKK
ncbi:hypothetical protein [Roseateles saccharophilus]|uniref:Uncharacterized protein n=1 Tax=Roseateles saccharophilus TaxID=304 RepID=A0A4R3V1Y3_ROSSA|nr:hypothetical protein [Roseateles saccharophilus]MDG0831875.1 hypothetical protein [Roseateles saccharophilus]TCU97461.1 hypothetical protein EV671_1011136 [Roseateles saccharophilus]